MSEVLTHNTITRKLLIHGGCTARAYPGSQLDAGKEGSAELAVQGVGFLRGGCQPVLHHHPAQLAHPPGQHRVCREVVYARLRKGLTHHEPGFCVGIHHHLGLIPCSTWHIALAAESIKPPVMNPASVGAFIITLDSSPSAHGTWHMDPHLLSQSQLLSCTPLLCGQPSSAWTHHLQHMACHHTSGETPIGTFPAGMYHAPV